MPFNVVTPNSRTQICPRANWTFVEHWNNFGKITFLISPMSHTDLSSNQTQIVLATIHSFNPLMATLKPQSNRPLYNNVVIGTLAVDGWAVTFGTVKRGLGGAPACPGPSSLYQM